MANGTGNGYWITKMLVGALWGVIIGVFMFLGNTVKANDNKTTSELTAVRKEIVIGDEKVLQKVERKMEQFGHEQVALKIQTKEILMLVRFLKERAE